MAVKLYMLIEHDATRNTKYHTCKYKHFKPVVCFLSKKARVINLTIIIITIINISYSSLVKTPHTNYEQFNAITIKFVDTTHF